MTRRTAELRHQLSSEGPAKVGTLASRTGLAVGSVSHHHKALHRYGFVEPAPDLARNTRESWWRIAPRDLSWLAEDFTAGTLGRRVAEDAELANFRHQVRAVQQWMAAAPALPEEWRRAASSTDTFVPATTEQTADLGRGLTALVTEWSAACREDAEAHPDAVRRPVRAQVRVWVAAVTVSWFGDAMWTVALAWTAALLAFGAVAAGAGLTVTCCLFGAAMGTLCLTLATRRAVSALH